MSDRPYSSFRSITVSNSAVDVRQDLTDLIGWNIQNLSATDISVKFYNAIAADVTVGNTTPHDSIQVSANNSVVLRDGERGDRYDIALSVAVTTGLADNDNTAAATAPIIKLYFD